MTHHRTAGWTCSFGSLPWALSGVKRPTLGAAASTAWTLPSSWSPGVLLATMHHPPYHSEAATEYPTIMETLSHHIIGSCCSLDHALSYVLKVSGFICQRRHVDVCAGF